MAGYGSTIRLRQGVLPFLFQAEIGQALLTRGRHAADLVDAHKLAVRPFTLHLVLEDVVHRDDVAFHAAHLGDLRDAPAAIAMAFHLYDDVDGAGDLRADGARRQAHIAHLHHVLDTGEGVARGVGVD